MTIRTATRAFATLLALTSLAACTDEDVVFRDRELFEDPPTAAMGMLGYSNTETKLTVCGNCHIGTQGQWEETAHAGAWEGLQASGSAQAFCEGCHTTNELGNVLTESAGFNTSPEARYHDVGCESCHGPGLAHVQNPTDATIPRAPLDVGLENTLGCGECHQGTHHGFVDQWVTSGHATNGFQATRDGCKDCHSGNGALERWGINTTYLEEGNPVAITCATCHDPHGSDNPAQLRFPIGGVEIEANLCSQCHDRRSEPDPESSHGLEPHSPETGLLAGDVGWFPPGLVIDRGEIIATHGSGANERLCATCHVASTTVTDAATGDFVFSAKGHGFNAIPCLDAEGIPTTADCGLSLEEREFAGCTGSGCHTSENGVFSALATATVRLQTLTDDLRTLLLQVDANLDEPGGPIDATDGVFTVADGAFFNMALAEFGGTDRPDARLTFAAAAAHNPFLTEQLLLASIAAVEAEFAVTASPSLVRERLLTTAH
ncbi:MAG: cytochrome c3 family protein [Longimicrobiales bacterium]|nr:cytochrome c3 family protein [Longimicrobiales bacterium]